MFLKVSIVTFFSLFLIYLSFKLNVLLKASPLSLDLDLFLSFSAAISCLSFPFFSSSFLNFCFLSCLSLRPQFLQFLLHIYHLFVFSVQIVQFIVLSVQFVQFIVHFAFSCVVFVFSAFNLLVLIGVNQDSSAWSGFPTASKML